LFGVRGELVSTITEFVGGMIDSVAVRLNETDSVTDNGGVSLVVGVIEVVGVIDAVRLAVSETVWLILMVGLRLFVGVTVAVSVIVMLGEGVWVEVADVLIVDEGTLVIETVDVGVPDFDGEAEIEGEIVSVGVRDTV